MKGIDIATKRFIFIAFSIFIFLLFYFILELIFYYINSSKADQIDDKHDGYPSGYIIKDDLLGYKPKADKKFNAKKIINKKTIYNVNYTIDEYSRRNTPLDNSSLRNRFAMFFGCSFTFGEGVNDNETIPYYYAKLARKYRPYNYGFHGYGPQQMLSNLQRDDIRSDILENQGFLIYLYVIENKRLGIIGHLDRAVGSMYVVNSRGDSMPFYSINLSGELIRKGNFTSARPILSYFYKILGFSSILKYFNIDFPLYNSDEHYHITARIILESQNEFIAKFNSDQFYVVVYPNGQSDKKLVEYLEKYQIKYFDYSSLFDPNNSHMHLIGDPHPSPKANKTIAYQLSRNLPI